MTSTCLLPFIKFVSPDCSPRAGSGSPVSDACSQGNREFSFALIRSLKASSEIDLLV